VTRRYSCYGCVGPPPPPIVELDEDASRWMPVETAECRGCGAEMLAPSAATTATKMASRRKVSNAGSCIGKPRFAGMEGFGISKLLESRTCEHLSLLPISYARPR